MKKIAVVFGTRPEAIKMCPLIKTLKKDAGAALSVIVTGQHRQMLDQVLSSFDITPDYDMNIMHANQTLSDVTSAILTELHGILETVRPEIVLVHGDTTTAFAAALCAFYLQIPVGHVEAGLRTYNLYSPYPEEFNRQTISLIARLHFAPTEQARLNLLKEGKQPDSVFVTGNTGIDALDSTVKADYHHPELDWAHGRRLVLITAHRRENMGQPMRQIFRAIRRIVAENPDVAAIYPVHKNPVLREMVQEELADCPNLHLIEPLDVLDFHNFLNRAYLVLTDSGGVQEEASALGTPALVMRDTTERPEGVNAGTLKLVGTQEEDIYREASRLLRDQNAYEKMRNTTNPYGDGHASERIAKVLMSGRWDCELPANSV